MSTQTRSAGPGILSSQNTGHCYETKKRHCVPTQRFPFVQEVGMCKQNVLHRVCSVEKDLGVVPVHLRSPMEFRFKTQTLAQILP